MLSPNEEQAILDRLRSRGHEITKDAIGCDNRLRHRLDSMADLTLVPQLDDLDKEEQRQGKRLSAEEVKTMFLNNLLQDSN